VGETNKKFQSSNAFNAENKSTKFDTDNGSSRIATVSGATVLVFVIGIFVIRICFVLRVSARPGAKAYIHNTCYVDTS